MEHMRAGGKLHGDATVVIQGSGLSRVSRARASERLTVWVLLEPRAYGLGSSVLPEGQARVAGLWGAVPAGLHAPLSRGSPTFV